MFFFHSITFYLSPPLFHLSQIHSYLSSANFVWIVDYGDGERGEVWCRSEATAVWGGRSLWEEGSAMCVWVLDSGAGVMMCSVYAFVCVCVCIY